MSTTLNCTGVVIEGEGFSAAALRAFVTGIGLTANIRFPLRSFSTLPEMAAWVRSRLVAVDVELGTDGELRDAFAYLSSHMRGA